MDRFRPAFNAWIFYLGLFLLLPALLRAQLRFVPNAGQWPEPFQYRTDLPGGAAFLQGNTVWYNFSNGGDLAHQMHHNPFGKAADTIEKGHAIKLEYLGASSALSLSPEKQYPTRFNYYIGAEKYWRSGLIASADIRYKNLYDGIDMLMEGGNDALKYTFFLKHGADPSLIRIRIVGASSTQVSEGALHIKTTVNEIREETPKAWQWEGDKKIVIPCRYVLRDNVVSFEFPQGFNSKLDLVIDPFVVFASYSGSIADNFGYTATYDDGGHAYGGGDVWNQGYPVTPGAYQKIFMAGRIDAGIMKFTPDGTQLLYATYLGGNQQDRPHSMIVNSDTDLIVLGTTFSTDFPLTKTAYDTIVNGYDIFITKFSPDGSKLLASTVVGGSARDGINNFPTRDNPLRYNYADDFRGEIIVDANGDVYVASTAHSSNFPTTSWSMQPTFAGLQEGVAFRMSKDLSKLRWSTFIGGKECDAAFGIQFDLKGNVYICGGTSSQNIFPDPKMYQDSITYSNGFHYDSVDAFVCHLTGDSGKFINGTYLGGNSFDQAFFVQVDTGGNVYLYGQTLSSKSGTFPIVNPRYQDKHSGQFISIFNPQLDKLIRSTVFGKGDSIPDISPSAFLVDNCGKVYISGWGGEVNQPQYGGHGGTTTGLRYTADAFQKSTDGSDFYIAVFAPMMDTLLYATFFGNSHAAEHVDGGTSRFDKHAVVYQSVCGSCDYTTDPNPDPITTPGAHSRINKGKRNGSNSPGCNNLVLKLDVRIPDIIAQFSAPQLVCKGDTTPAIVRFTNLSKRATAYQWSFGDGSTSSGAELEHTFYDTGTYKVTLVAINPNSCSLTDTFSQFVKVVKHSSASFTIKSQACDGTVTLEATGAAAQYNWNFGDGTYKKGKIVSHTFTSDGTYLVRLYADSGTLCVDSSKAPIFISFTTASFSYMIDTCSGAVTFKNNSNGGVFYTWDFGDNTYDTVLNPVHVYKTKTSFKVTLTVTDNRNCIVTHSDSVRIKNGLVANFGFVQDSCSGRAAFTNYSKFARKYLWDFGDGTTDTSKNPIHFFTHDTLYTIRLVATASGGCSDTTEHKLNGVLSPVAKFTFRKDSCTSDVTFKSESFRGYRYDWIFGDGSDIVHATNPTHTYDKKGTYTAALIINSGSACTDTFTQKITVTNNKPSPVIIPNVFTPNDDGKNDRFIVEGNTVCIELEIEIYNRWGQLVFKQKGNPLTWDGHSIQGHELPAGVYYYIFRDPNFGERHGTVTLLRE